MADTLTPKQRLFVGAYVGRANGNALEAARLAGYAGNANVLGVAGARLLKIAKVAAAIATHQRKVEDLDIAVQRHRITAKQDRWERLKQIVRERSEDLSMAQVPGGTTGLIVRQYKVAGRRLMEEFVLDTGLLAEFSRLENDTGKELGQIVEKREHTGRDGGPIEVLDLTRLSVEELDDLERTLDKAAVTGGS